MRKLTMRNDEKFMSKDGQEKLHSYRIIQEERIACQYGHSMWECNCTSVASHKWVGNSYCS